MRMPSLAALLLFCLGAQGLAEDGQESAHDFSFVSIDGGPLPLSTFSGKVILIVNTASLCGFTKQYAELQALHERYVEKGLVVLGVPSNDFGSQEPGESQEIKSFCEVNYGINFPMTEKVKVKGENAHPFYAWAAEEVGFVGKPRWNFHKYLIARDQQLVDYFHSTTAPDAKRVIQAVENALGAKPD